MTKPNRVALQPAYILHHRPYRDTSLLIEAFTPDLGRVGLVARGARADRSRMQGLLQPFCPLLLSWSGRGDLGTLSAAEAKGAPLRLRGTRLFCGYYLSELVLRLLPRHAPHPALYHAYEAALYALESSASAPEQERVLRLFEKRLLQESGYGLLLECEADTERAIVPDRLYRYQLEKGPLPHDTPDPGRTPDITPGIPVHGSTLLGLAREALDDPVNLREAKALMRAALALYLGDRPLKSREFYRQAVQTAHDLAEDL
jgi:DNA repair protein RecO (recombination protein O)